MIEAVYSIKNYQYQLNYIPYRYRYKHLKKKKILPLGKQNKKATLTDQIRTNRHIQPNHLCYSQPPTSRITYTPERSWQDESQWIEMNATQRKISHQDDYRNKRLAPSVQIHKRTDKQREQILWRQSRDQNLQSQFNNFDQQYCYRGGDAMMSTNKIKCQVNRRQVKQKDEHIFYKGFKYRVQDNEDMASELFRQQHIISDVLEKKLADTTVRSSLKTDQPSENKLKSGNFEKAMTIPSIRSRQEMYTVQAEKTNQLHLDPRDGLLQSSIQYKNLGIFQTNTDKKNNIEQKKDSSVNIYPTNDIYQPTPKIDKSEIQLKQPEVADDNHDLWHPKQENCNQFANQHNKINFDDQKLLEKPLISSYALSSYALNNDRYHQINANKGQQSRKKQRNSPQQQDHQTCFPLNKNKQQTTTNLSHKTNKATIIGSKSNQYSEQQRYNYPQTKEQQINEAKIYSGVKDQSTKGIQQLMKPIQQSARSLNRKFMKQNQAFDDRTLQKSQKGTRYFGEIDRFTGKSYATRLHVKQNDKKSQSIQAVDKGQRYNFSSQKIKSLQSQHTPAKIDKEKDMERIWSFSDLISQDDPRLINSKPQSSRANQDSPFIDDQPHPLNILRFSQPFKPLTSGKQQLNYKHESDKLQERKSEVKSFEQDHLLKMMGGSDNLKQVSSLRLDSNQSGLWNQQALKDELSYFLKANRLPQQSPITLSEEPSLFSSTFRFENQDLDFNLMDALRNEENNLMQENEGKKQKQGDQENDWVRDDKGYNFESKLIDGQRLLLVEKVEQEVLFGGELNRDSYRFMEVIEQSEQNYMPSTSTSRAQLVERSIQDYKHHFHPRRQALQKFKKSTQRSNNSKSKSPVVGQSRFLVSPCRPRVKWDRETGQLQRQKARWQINLTRFKTRINKF